MNQKAWQLRMHCNFKAVRRRAVPIRFTYDGHAKFEIAQPIRCRLIAFFLLIRYVMLTLTCIVDHHGQTLYQIWAQSNIPRRSYCDLNIWPYDLEHVSRVALCSEIVCTTFKLSQAVCSRNVTIFMLIRYVTYAMTLTFDPLTLKVCGRSGVTWCRYR